MAEWGFEARFVWLHSSTLLPQTISQGDNKKKNIFKPNSYFIGSPKSLYKNTCIWKMSMAWDEYVVETDDDNYIFSILRRHLS